MNARLFLAAIPVTKATSVMMTKRDVDGKSLESASLQSPQNTTGFITSSSVSHLEDEVLTNVVNHSYQENTTSRTNSEPRFTESQRNRPRKTTSHKEDRDASIPPPRHFHASARILVLLLAAVLLLPAEGLGQAAETEAVEKPIQTKGAEETIDNATEAETVELEAQMSALNYYQDRNGWGENVPDGRQG